MKITNIMATSLDGKIASHPLEKDQFRRKIGFTDEYDRQHIKKLIQKCDIVITGANSIKSVDKIWSFQNDKTVYPIWAIFSNKSIFDQYKKFTDIPNEIWFITKNKSNFNLKYSNIKIFSYLQEDPVDFLINKIKKLEYKRINLLGGSEINQMFYNKKLVDELILTLCPIIIAKEKAPSLVKPPLDDNILLSIKSYKINVNHIYINYKINY